jgi:iron complex transport system ATP-binding protein
MKLIVKNLKFSYASTPIIENICMELAPGEVLGIVGPNGAGKSTLLRCIDRILNPLSGSILLDEKEMKKMSQMEIARHIGYVPQTSARFLPATVFDTVLMGRRPHLGWRSSEQDTEKIFEALKLLKIEHLAFHEFNTLSGGQQQKVLITRALAQEAEIILLDEPTSNLDIRHQLEAMDIITKLVKEKKISAIMAIHDLNLGSRYSDRIIMLKGGIIIDAGNPSTVLTIENIKQVYGVEAVVNEHNGIPYIIPIRPIRPN